MPCNPLSGSSPTGALTGGTCPHSHRTFQSEGTGGARCSVVLGRLAMQAFAVKRMRSLKPAREQLLQQRYPPLPLLLQLFHSRCRKLRPPSPTRTVPSEKFSFYLDFYKLGRMYCFTPADAKPTAQRPNGKAHRRHRTQCQTNSLRTRRRWRPVQRGVRPSLTHLSPSGTNASLPTKPSNPVPKTCC